MAQPPALIISRDPVAAALVGGAAEVAGLAPQFVPATANPVDILRASVPAAVLTDCEHPVIRDSAFIGPALMTGARVAIFCNGADPEATHLGRTTAARLGVDYFELPADAEQLTRFLAEAA